MIGQAEQHRQQQGIKEFGEILDINDKTERARRLRKWKDNYPDLAENVVDDKQGLQEFADLLKIPDLTERAAGVREWCKKYPLLAIRMDSPQGILDFTEICGIKNKDERNARIRQWMQDYPELVENMQENIREAAETEDEDNKPVMLPRNKPVHVKGYYRKDGTYVRPHTRSR